MTRREELNKMIAEAFALQKRDATGQVVKIGKREENIVKSRVSFANIVCPVAKSHKPEDESEPRRQGAQELKDLDVDRVDGVDRPATGRSFLLFKSEDGDAMPDDERRGRGVAPLGERKFKMSFASILGNPTRHAAREYPLEQQPSRQPRGADEGEDELGREYAEGEFLEQYASMGRMNGAPNAGAGPTWTGDTRDAPLRPARFMPGGEGDAGRVGGEDRGVKPEQLGELGDVAVRSGPNYILAPIDPGIAPASQFKAPDADTRVLKSRPRPGIFKSAVFGAHGDLADGFLG